MRGYGRSGRVRRQTVWRFLAVMALVGTALAAWVAGPASAATNFATPAFQTQWQAGESITPNFWGPLQNAREGQAEPYVEGNYNGQSGQRLVQYFDKARMELNTPSSPVTSGLLATELITGKLQQGDNTFTQLQPAGVPVAGDPDNIGPTYASIGTAQLTTGVASTPNAQTTRQLSATGTLGTYSGASAADPQATIASYDTDTRHNIAAAFLAFRTKVNLLNVGFAISEPFWSNVKVAGVQKDVLVQAFQRRVLTYTPSNPDPFKVEFGNIGQHYYNWRYNGAGAAAATPTTTAAPVSTPTFTNLTNTSVTVVYTTASPSCGTAEYRVLGNATWISNIDSITCTSGSATTTQSINLTGLTPGTTYEVRGAVKDVNQNVTYGASATVTTLTTGGTAAATTAPTAAATEAATSAPASATTAPAAATTPSGSPTPNPLPSRSP